MADIVESINIVSSFLAQEDLSNPCEVNHFLRALPKPRTGQPTDAIVFCASSVLALADTVFSAFSAAPPVAGEESKITRSIAHELQGMPEARVLQMIAEKWFGIKAVNVGDPGAKILPHDMDKLLVVVEDQSTNCGANASESRKVLEACGVTSPRSIVVVQDPTMSRRTVATFRKTYADLSPRLVSWPTFTPRVALDLEFVTSNSSTESPIQQLQYADRRGVITHDEGLWGLTRFVDLIMGEIPRLRDDENGYGPKGKNFLVHVDIPQDVDNAWKFLDTVLEQQSRQR
ncbi:Protein YdcF [Colletotrichum trifolii]|uniref:Protein YdcF n=1 Tax=Colletotrichum trifolii TaxID=5466 RepID=A0A4R8QC13_COLTR|nr:Protein YdcF [Colletotrichum trifolii]